MSLRSRLRELRAIAVKVAAGAVCYGGMAVMLWLVDRETKRRAQEWRENERDRMRWEDDGGRC